jgi:regulator of protease activity HflC (stomatin/prohibitin superfamily)
MEAEADAEAEILRGEAKAFAIEARAKAEAEQVNFGPRFSVDSHHSLKDQLLAYHCCIL